MEFVLKGIFDYAVSNGWIGENPVDRVTVPKIASDDMVFLSVREVELLADEAEKIGKPVDGLLVRWQAYTGCRIGESLALKVGVFLVKSVFRVSSLIFFGFRHEECRPVVCFTGCPSCRT